MLAGGLLLGLWHVGGRPALSGLTYQVWTKPDGRAINIETFGAIESLTPALTFLPRATSAAPVGILISFEQND